MVTQYLNLRQIDTDMIFMSNGDVVLKRALELISARGEIGGPSNHSYDTKEARKYICRECCD
jgi:hypothetical protein